MKKKKIIAGAVKKPRPHWAEAMLAAIEERAGGSEALLVAQAEAHALRQRRLREGGSSQAGSASGAATSTETRKTG